MFLSCGFCGRKSGDSDVVALFRLFCAFARRVLCFNPGERSTNEYHLVAATIPEDRLRAEERYPRSLGARKWRKLEEGRGCHELPEKTKMGRGEGEWRNEDGCYLVRTRRFIFLDSPAKRYISRSLGKRTMVQTVGPPNGGRAHSRSHILSYCL